ncbi:MAG: hypothetical protein OEV07_08165, partial [Gammaproteobacteria bacterium]|nr:hypothetical protein [Gammaproteobacteria bacterium]
GHAMANSVRIFTLSADEWARPRSGAVIPQLSAVRSAVNYWGKDGNRLVIIRYPGEDSGELWAAELRDWLISLGVPADYIRLVSGTQAAEEIKLMVGNRDELEQ